MKKLILLTIGISLLLGSCTSSKEDIKENDWTELDLIGEVEHFKEFYYEAIEKFGKIEKGNSVVNTRIPYDKTVINPRDKFITFNNRGQIDEEIRYESDNKILSRKSISYNDKNKIAISESYFGEGIDKDSFSYDKTTYKYDDEDNLIEIDYSDSKVLFKYDAKNNRIEYNYINYSGDLIEKEIYEYDAKSNRIEDSNYNSDGTLTWRTKYDDKNNRIEKSDYSSDGELKYKQTYKYDDKNNRIEKSHYSSNGKLHNKEVYEYDAIGNLIGENYYVSDGTLYRRFIYKYDDKNNMIEELTIIERGITTHNKIHYEYEYDEKGNWLKKIKFKNSIPYFIIEREIEYFD